MFNPHNMWTTDKTGWTHMIYPSTKPAKTYLESLEGMLSFYTEEIERLEAKRRYIFSRIEQEKARVAE